MLEIQIFLSLYTAHFRVHLPPWKVKKKQRKKNSTVKDINAHLQRTDKTPALFEYTHFVCEPQEKSFTPLLNYRQRVVFFLVREITIHIFRAATKEKLFFSLYFSPLLHEMLITLSTAKETLDLTCERRTTTTRILSH